MLAGFGRLLSCVDLDELSYKFAKLYLCEIDDLIVLFSQRGDYDEEFETVVASWDEVRFFGKVESIDFIPCCIGDLVRAKTRAE